MLVLYRCPTRYRTWHFFNNFTTSEDIGTKFDTHYRHALQTHTTDTHYRHALHTHTTYTHYRHTTYTHYRHALQTHTIDTHYRHALQTHTKTHSYSFLTQRTNSFSNFFAISSLVLELLK